RSADRGGANQRTGLARVHGSQTVVVEGEAVTRYLVRRLQIDRLAADHAEGPCSLADRPGDAQFSRGERGVVAAGGLTGEQGERLGVQPVAGENRDPVSVDRMQRRPA